MSGNPLLSAIALVMICSGCEDRPHSPGSSAERPRVAAMDRGDTGLEREGSEELVSQGIGQAHRLQPDRRFVVAFTRVASLAKRDKVSPCRANRESRGWTLRCRKGSAWRVPERPGFDRLMVLLDAWARERSPPPKGRARPSRIPPVGNLYPARAAIRALNVLDGRWLAGHSPSLLPPAARALAALVLQLSDGLELADGLVANALAVTALAASQGGASMRRARAMLAEAMGYPEAARRLVAKLPAGDPLRAYVLRDDGKLVQLATREQAPLEARYLWWRRLVDQGHLKQEIAFRRQHLADHQLSLSMLGARSALPGGPNPAALALPWIALDQALPPYRLDAVPLRAPRGDLPEVRAAIRQISRRLTTSSYRLVRGLERLLEIRRGTDPGALFDADLQQRVYQAYAYTGVQHLAVYYVDTLRSPEAARQFLLRFRRVEAGVAREVKRWYEHYLDAAWHGNRARAVLGSLTSFRRLGAPPLWRLYERAAKTMAPRDPKRAVALIRLAARMDSRPTHRRWLARAAKRR